jgi:acetyl esterase/lipase
MSVTTWMLRRMFQKSDDKRDAGLTTPENIKRWDNICYGSDKNWQMLDVYRPKDVKGDLPVIVSVHGGGWTYGDKERYQWYCMNLAQRGFAVVNFTYHLAPEFHFPTGIEDTHLVFSWVLSHGAEYGFDINRIFAVGDSAGAQMLTIYSCLCANEVYAGKLGIARPTYPDGSPFVPAAVGLNFGIYVMSKDPKVSSTLTRSLMKELLENHGDERELDLVNPIPYINANFPRAYVVTGNADPLAGPPAQKILTEALEQHGIIYQDITYGTKDHPLGHVFHCDIRSEDAKKCNDEECAFFLRP